MDSSLNPEAPEFQPSLQTTAQDGYKMVQNSIRSVNQMPMETSYRLYKTYCDFDSVTNQIIENVILQSNNILSTDFPKVKLKNTDQEGNSEKIIDINDYILDRIHITIDSLCSENNGNQIWINNPIPSSNGPEPAMEAGPTVSTPVQNFIRPQFLFKDRIDNSENLWVPKIFDKPNNIKPLALTMLYNNEDKAIGYENPYKTELDAYSPPIHFIIPDECDPTFPLPLEQTPLVYVDTKEQVDALINHLNTVPEIAVDLEHHSQRSYQGITCLIQLTTSYGDFIIDALAVREHLYKLNESFTNPNIMKVFHGASNDILWLQRDFGVYVVGMFDTFYASRELNLKNKSLKYLLMKYCAVDIDKRHQLADWRVRPLSAELLQYARSDTHYLLYIWRCMKKDLLARASGQNYLLMSVFSQSTYQCGSTYEKPVIKENDHLGMYLSSRKTFNSRQMMALRILYKWRDMHARMQDDSPSFIMSNHTVMSLAESLPGEVQSAINLCVPISSFMKLNMVSIHQMILSCRELPLESVLYPVPASVNNNVQSSEPFPKVLDSINLFNRESVTGSVEEANLFDSPPSSPTPTDEGDQKSFTSVVSDLNVYAKLYVPPFDRYRAYRAVAWDAELKQFQEKETKIAALGEGNELIKSEVLDKLHEANVIKEKQIKELGSVTNTDNAITSSDEVTNAEVDSDQKCVQRKRKISNTKNELKPKSSDVNETIDTQKINTNEQTRSVKPFNYKNANYKKFHYNSQKDHKNVTKFSKKRK